MTLWLQYDVSSTLSVKTREYNKSNQTVKYCNWIFSWKIGLTTLVLATNFHHKPYRKNAPRLKPLEPIKNHQRNVSFKKTPTHSAIPTHTHKKKTKTNSTSENASICKRSTLQSAHAFILSPRSCIYVCIRDARTIKSKWTARTLSLFTAIPLSPRINFLPYAICLPPRELFPDLSRGKRIPVLRASFSLVHTLYVMCKIERVLRDSVSRWGMYRHQERYAEMGGSCGILKAGDGRRLRL